ncbi:MAG: sulfite exporter TauE/SafE family protein [Pyrinomonadaceae bacterium]
MLKPSNSKQRAFAIFLLTVMAFGCVFQATAHPLGNFTINHFTQIEVGNDLIKIHYVVDMAEIPTFQELQVVDADRNGQPSNAELTAYLELMARRYAEGIIINVDGVRVPLVVGAKTITTPQGQGGLPTLRIECDLSGTVSSVNAGAAHRLQFEDTNYSNRIGWREIVVTSGYGISVFDSSAYGTSVSDQLRAYPNDVLTAPLNERTAELQWTPGAAPAGSTALLNRNGRPASASRDQLTELISVSELTPGIALFSLLVAIALGGIHAFSPGHGKTVVGAYLVGSRGTPRHAAFLGLVVTITHTLGVFALGIVTLFASQYIMPERLFPILGFVSGGIVIAIGGSLFVRRLRAALAGQASQEHSHHQHEHNDRDHDHTHEHDDNLHGHLHTGTSPLIHSHGGREHSHLPPGSDGTPITWRSLLALGISGGLLPCPSALVVLLAAIALHRVGFGILLVVAFSIGLAATLTGIGLAFLYAGRLVKHRVHFSAGKLVRILPVASAFVIMCLGILICYEGLLQAGVNVSTFASSIFAPVEPVTNNPLKTVSSMGAMAVLGLGLVFGLKHATEVDHVVAVSTIVSEQRKLLRAALVGGLWGAGHTVSLIIVGVVVLALRISIPESVATWLEFGVALMIIWLGANALMRALRERSKIHLHKHEHGGEPHIHIHFHEPGAEHQDISSLHSHAVTRIGFKPLIVGMMHGLAGSAALTLLVLTQIDSAVLGLLYLAIFGVGSIIGMVLMSGLVGLPFALSSRKFAGVHHRLQIAAGALSLAFGLWYAYASGLAHVL